MASGLLVYERDVIDQRPLVEALFSWLEEVYPLPRYDETQQHIAVPDEPSVGLLEAICRRLLGRLIPEAPLSSQWASRHPALNVSLVKQLIDERRLGAELFEARYRRAPQFWFGVGLWASLTPRAARLRHLIDQEYVLLSKRSQLDLLLTWTALGTPHGPRAIISGDEPDPIMTLEAWRKRLGLTLPWRIASWSSEGYTSESWDSATWSSLGR